LGTYVVREVQQAGYEPVFPADPSFYTVVIPTSGSTVVGRDFSNQMIPTPTRTSTPTPTPRPRVPAVCKPDATRPAPRAPSASTGRLAAPRAMLASAYGRLPLHFEPTDREDAARVRFVARGSGYGLFLTADAALLQLRAASSPSRNQDAAPEVLRLQFAGA